MRNISAKPSTLRSARAEARLRLPAFCVDLIRERKVEKGDALEIARVAAILAAKRTWELLPLCHQLPLTHAEVSYEIGAAEIRIETTVETVSGTGVEMEALTAASVAALTLYDLLKPHAEQDMEILGVRLLAKTGGKSDYARRLDPPGRAVLIPVGKVRESTIAAAGRRLEALGLAVGSDEAIPADALDARLRHWLALPVDLVATLGGTGIARDDRTVSILRPLLDKELPGLMEAARAYGQARTPYALMSGGVAGLRGRTLLLALPGSERGAIETIIAVEAGLVHTLEGLRR